MLDNDNWTFLKFLKTFKLKSNASSVLPEQWRVSVREKSFKSEPRHLEEPQTSQMPLYHQKYHNLENIQISILITILILKPHNISNEVLSTLIGLHISTPSYTVRCELSIEPISTKVQGSGITQEDTWKTLLLWK